MEKLTVKGTRFVNESGKEVILHGLNVLQRQRENNHFYPGFEKAFGYFRRSGFNLLRFGIFWDGAEPEPGQVDMEYLRKVKNIVNLAEENGIYILLDMHQDLFAQKFIDGAPDWACLDEGLPHPEHCKLWYEAYLQSDAIIRAADNFWANKPASDGVGLLDHYAAMWGKIAEALDGCGNIIGFEPMNEPFMGSLARESFGAATMKMMEKYPAFDMNHPETIPPEQAGEFMALVSERFLEFDRTVLMDFYRRYEAFSKENVERLYAGKRQTQERLGLPTIAAEWGAFPSREFTNDLINHMNSIIERNLWGSAYCEYHPGMEEDPNFSALCRAYPMETAGTLRKYHYDRRAREYAMDFDSDGGESRLYLPFEPREFVCPQELSTSLEPLGDGRYICRIQAPAGPVSLAIR